MDRCFGGSQKFKLTNLHVPDVPDVVKLTPEQERICQIYNCQHKFLELPSTQAAMQKLCGFLADNTSRTRGPIKDKIIMIIGDSGQGKTKHAEEALRDYHVTTITRDARNVPEIVKYLEANSMGSKSSEMKCNALLIEGLEEMDHITNLVTTIPVVGTCANIPRTLWHNRRRVYFKISRSDVSRILVSRGLDPNADTDITQASIKAVFGGDSNDVVQNPFEETRQLIDGRLSTIQSDIAPYLLQENYLKVASLDEAQHFAESMAQADMTQHFVESMADKVTDVVQSYDALPLRFKASRSQRIALTGPGSLRKHTANDEVLNSFQKLRPPSYIRYEMMGKESFLKHQGRVLSHRAHNKEQHNLHGNTAASSHSVHASLTEGQDLEATVSLPVGPSDMRAEPEQLAEEPEQLAPVVIKQEGLLKLIRCEPKAFEGDAELILPQAHVAKEIRNKEYCILVGAPKTLMIFLRGYTDYIWTSAGEAVVFRTGAKRTEVPTGVKLFTFPRGTKILPLVEKMLHMKGMSTVKVQRVSSQVEEGYACRTIQPYLSMSKFHFQGLLIDLESKLDKTDEEEFMVQNSTKMLQLRNAGQEFEMAKAFITYWREARLAPVRELNLATLRARQYHVKEKVWKTEDFLRVFKCCMEEATFVLCGPPQGGKTPLARTMAATYAEAKGIDYFIQSSTMDSLRQVFVQGFFRPGVAVILDEFRPGTMSQSPKTDCCDMLKCLCDVANPGSVHCRYSDIKFAEEMPRIITTNATRDEWLQICDSATEADRDAVLKRLIFVEVDGDVVPQAFAQVFRNKKRRDIGDLMSATLESRGVKIPKLTLDDHGLTAGVSLFQ